MTSTNTQNHHAAIMLNMKNGYNLKMVDDTTTNLIDHHVAMQ
jgi:hypothetical protein